MTSKESRQSREGMIHPTAVIEPGAEVGENVRIGPFAVIGSHVSIGADCEIGAHAVLDGYLSLGERNRVFSSAVIGSSPDGLTHIGNHCLLMACTHVGHDCFVGDHIIMANGTVVGGHSWMGDWAFLGGLAAVHQFSTIGTHAFIGGASRATVDVPPYVKAAGNPLRIAGVNSIGLTRRGFSAESIARIKRAYRYLFRRGLRAEEALARIVEEGEDEVSAAFQEFFRRTTRGIVR